MHDNKYDEKKLNKPVGVVLLVSMILAIGSVILGIIGHLVLLLIGIALVIIVSVGFALYANKAKRFLKEPESN